MPHITPHLLRLLEFSKHHLSPASIVEASELSTHCLPANVLPQLVFPGVSCTQTTSALYSTAQPHATTSPSLVQWCLKERMTSGFSWVCKVTLVTFLDVPYTLSTMRQEDSCQQLALSPEEGCEQNQDEDQLLIQEQPWIQNPPDTALADTLEMPNVSHQVSAAHLD